jgi:hypothetical protein
MDLGEAIFLSQFILPEHKPGLTELLRRDDFDWLVDAPHSEEPRLQGDLLRSVPVALIDSQGQPRTAALPAMVINNTCDLQQGRSNFVTVAPASEYEVFAEKITRERATAQSAASYMRHIQSNRIDEVIFIPRCPGFAAGLVVHLDRLCSLSSPVYDLALAEGQRLASFSQSGFYYLLIKMTRFLARAEPGDVAPRSALG